MSSAALKSVCATLELYAWHQQSKSYPVAWMATEEADKPKSFARACRAMNFDLEQAQGVRRRLASIEAASNFSGVLISIRALIRLMKSAKDSQGKSLFLSFDYGELARDLYLMQLSDKARQSVMSRWGAEYFLTSKTA